MIRINKNSETYPGESIGLKFIPIQSELFRFIPTSASEPVRIIPKKRLVSHLMKNGKETILLNPIQSEASIRIIPTSDTSGLILIEHSIWINPSSDLKTLFVWVRIHSNSASDKVELISDRFPSNDTKRFSDWFGMVRIGSDTDIGMNSYSKLLPG